jgi:hypothetical protein
MDSQETTKPPFEFGFPFQGISTWFSNVHEDSGLVGVAHDEAVNPSRSVHFARTNQKRGGGFVQFNKTLENLVEVAAVNVPVGSIGHLEDIDQLLASDDGQFYPTGASFWGSLHTDSEVMRVRWFLRVVPINYPRILWQWTPGSAPKWITNLPGNPFGDLSEFGLWYPAHNGSARIRCAIIPGGYSLRLYCYSPETVEYAWAVQGRLRGYITRINDTTTKRELTECH